MVTSPLVSRASPARKRGEHATTLGPKQAVDAVTALLLGEAGFKAQALEDAPPPPPPPQKSPPSPSSPPGGKKTGPSNLSESSAPSLVAQRRRMELGAQLVLARALGGAGGRGDGSASSCSSFAVRLHSGPTPAAAAAATAADRARKNKGGAGGPSRDSVGVGGVIGVEGDGGGGSKKGREKLGGGGDEKKSRATSAEKRQDGALALQEDRGGNELGKGPRANEAAAMSVAAVAADAYGGSVSDTPDCELCVLRGGVPYALPCIV